MLDFTVFCFTTQILSAPTWIASILRTLLELGIPSLLLSGLGFNPKKSTLGPETKYFLFLDLYIFLVSGLVFWVSGLVFCSRGLPEPNMDVHLGAACRKLLQSPMNSKEEYTNRPPKGHLHPFCV